MTYYLKYRPKTIEELDLTTVRDRLSMTVKKKQFAHAYLFYGPKGTGKTSSARIIAKRAGAETDDIIELDAASNRGIDDIRQLRERVGISPMTGEKTAYIIDEVHMLTAEAFNALLKTLEEPPPHVLFFLCTTELEKVPATVVSRCVAIPFSKATDEEVIRSLRRAVVGEQLTVSDAAFAELATMSDGSFRDAHKLLEQLVTETQKKNLDREDVEKLRGSVKDQDVAAYVTGVIDGNVTLALNVVSSVVKRGGDMEWFARAILMALRDLLIQNPSPRILDVTRVVEERTRTVKFSLIPQLPLEIAALELASGELGIRGKESEEKTSNESEERSEEFKVKNQGQAVTFEQLLGKWSSVLDRVREKNHGIVTLLAHCTPKDLSGETVTIEAKYQFHREQLTQAKFRSLLQEAFVDVLGTSLVPKIVLGDQTSRVLHRLASDDTIRAAVDDELVQAAEDIFS